MPGSQRIPCALKGSGQILLSATESSAVQAAPHGWRPGQVRLSWIPVLCMSCLGFDCIICEILDNSSKKRTAKGLCFEEGSLNT